MPARIAAANPAGAQRWFRWACLFELALLGLAGAAGWLWQQSVAGGFHWRVRDLLAGGLAALPLIFGFVVSQRSAWKPLAGIRAFLETVVRPVFQQWSLGQLALVSLLAGVGEEALFRAVLQGGLTRAFGFPLALVLASAVFGLGHGVTRAYAILAAILGLYLGLLWWLTGNLLAPVIAHGLYDFVALVYFLRIGPRPPATAGEGAPPAEVEGPL